jgi:predicted ester cyclase
MSEDNKAIIRKLFERVDGSDISVIEDAYADNFVDHNPPPFAAGTPGAEGARENFELATKIFTGWTHEIAAQFSDGDFVITRVIGRGKHTGDFLGTPASNADVQMEGIAIHRFENGKIVEHWGQVDVMSMLGQIGALPPPGH